MEFTFKRSAIHNLVITNHDLTSEINEGLVMPKHIMDQCDIVDWEQIIVTKINGNNWINRIKTFAISGKDNKVTARGSLCKFLDIGSLTCIITYTKYNQQELDFFLADRIPIIDLGFDPTRNKDNSIKPSIHLEYYSKKAIASKTILEQAINYRRAHTRTVLSNLILGLKVNNTHPDCLHGSAELPSSIMNANDLNKYRNVSVYNVSEGGLAETYAVSMPEGIIMTTGSMAAFAKKGDLINVASYIDTVYTDERKTPTMTMTDGTHVIK